MYGVVYFHIVCGLWAMHKVWRKELANTWEAVKLNSLVHERYRGGAMLCICITSCIAWLTFGVLGAASLIWEDRNGKTN